MIVQRCRAPLSVHNVMNLCCPTTFAPTAAATGERPSSKKKKHRMIALREKARMPRAPVLSSCATAEGGEERGFTLKGGPSQKGGDEWPKWLLHGSASG